MEEKRLKAFCEEHGIPVRLERRWHEHIFRFLYNSRMRDYEADVYVAYSAYTQLQEAVREARDFYEKFEIPRVEAYTADRMEILMPDINFSNLNNAVRQMRKWRMYFTNGTNSQNVYSEMLKKSNEVLRQAREKFIREAIQELPDSKNVVIIRTKYQPYEFNKKSFDSSVKEMAENPREGCVSISVVLMPNWLAFCPRCETEESLADIIQNWGGEPKDAVITYK